MGDITGPISSLPGTSHTLPKGTTCERHPDRLAVTRIQGETDSFGSELYDMCQECADEHRAYRRSAEARTGKCDWCKTEATDLRDRRDHEEGLCGPVYQVCGACHARQEQRDREYLDQYYNDFDDYGDDEPALDGRGA